MRLVTRAIVVAAALAALVACNKKSPTEPGGGSSNTNGNRNPVIASMSVTPPLLVSGLTTFHAMASATDADSDPLTYMWAYGSKTASGASISGTVTGDGPMAFKVTASDGKGGSASDSRSVTVGTMTGDWLIFVDACKPNSFPLTLTQSGSMVSGSAIAPTVSCTGKAGARYYTDPAEPGVIDAAGNLTLRVKVASFSDFPFQGTMQSDGRTVVGEVVLSGTHYATTFKKQ